SKGNGSQFFPYGESRSSSPGDDRENFATYSRDSLSGLDYADQRYYAPSLGRFLTPDPAGVGLNHYAYSDADPINGFDPSGLFAESAGGSQTRVNDYSCYLEGRSFCGGNGGGFGGGPVLSSPQDLAWAYGLIGSGQALTPASIDWSLLYNKLEVALHVGQSQSATFSILEELARVAPNSIAPAVVVVPVLIDLGTIINATGATITIGILWETVREFLRSSKTWTVNCNVHPIGTYNHETVGRIRRYGVRARTDREAIELAKPGMEDEMQRLYGPVGFQLQHCNAW
ncbi:MAG: RHS repeat-associated core domain-containing protein, partial [Acidobacteriota bacterium]